MNRSPHACKFVPVLFALVAVHGLISTRMAAQAPPAAGLPNSVPVSPGPNTNLYKHVMKKADILAALAQVQSSWDLVVKSNAAITLRASANTTKLPWKNHVEADELWFVYRGAAKVALAPFSLMVGVTPPGNTYDVGEGDIVSVPRGLAYQITPTAGRFEYVAVRRYFVDPGVGKIGYLLAGIPPSQSALPQPPSAGRGTP